MKVSLAMLEAGIGRLVLEAPAANRLTRPDFMDPGELDAFLAQPGLKGVLVTGQGRHFSAGAELGSLAAQARAGTLPASIARGKRLLESLSQATVPVVAAIRGSCLGAGLEIALACHFRVAAENALLGFPELGYGFIPGMGASVFGAEHLPAPRLMDLMLSTRLVLGTEALEMGLVDRVAAGATPEAAALAWLGELTGRHRPELIRAALATIHEARFLPRAEALANESRRFFQLIQDAELHG